MGDTYDAEYAKAVRQHEAEQKAKALVDALSKFANGMHGVEADAFATALANEHPTLLGQIAKQVGTGVMRRAVRSAEWRPYDPTHIEGGQCRKGALLRSTTDGSPLYAEHPDHDGRLDCTTVIGAELMARQSFI